MTTLSSLGGATPALPDTDGVVGREMPTTLGVVKEKKANNPGSQRSGRRRTANHRDVAAASKGTEAEKRTKDATSDEDPSKPAGAESLKHAGFAKGDIKNDDEARDDHAHPTDIEKMAGSRSPSSDIEKITSAEIHGKASGLGSFETHTAAAAGDDGITPSNGIEETVDANRTALDGIKETLAAQDGQAASSSTGLATEAATVADDKNGIASSSDAEITGSRRASSSSIDNTIPAGSGGKRSTSSEFVIDLAAAEAAAAADFDEIGWHPTFEIDESTTRYNDMRLHGYKPPKIRGMFRAKELSLFIPEHDANGNPLPPPEIGVYSPGEIDNFTPDLPSQKLSKEVKAEAKALEKKNRMIKATQEERARKRRHELWKLDIEDAERDRKNAEAKAALPPPPPKDHETAAALLSKHSNKRARVASESDEEGRLKAIRQTMQYHKRTFRPAANAGYIPVDDNDDEESTSSAGSPSPTCGDETEAPTSSSTAANTLAISGEKVAAVSHAGVTPDVDDSAAPAGTPPLTGADGSEATTSATTARNETSLAEAERGSSRNADVVAGKGGSTVSAPAAASKQDPARLKSKTATALSTTAAAAPIATTPAATAPVVPPGKAAMQDWIERYVKENVG